MRNRSNYGIVGAAVTANLSVGGLYTLVDQQLLKSSNNWIGPPKAPTIGVPTIVGPTSISVAFTPPTDTGGIPITSYTVTSSPGGFTASGSSSPITVTGLTTGQAYTFTVTAINAIGTGPASSASISITPALLVDYLIVAGGGAGGGNYNSGGGGAGGLLSATNVTLTVGTTYTCTVGGGATGTTGFVLRGSNSSISGTGFSTVTAVGGGGGGSYTSTGNISGAGGGSAAQGGSGGGASGYMITPSYSAPGVYPGSTWLSAARQGYDGGVGGQYGSGGGGGAGQAGSNGQSSLGGNGGNGVQSSITGTAVYYAGGGGGAAYAPGPTAITPGSGGLGGGGRGGTYYDAATYPSPAPQSGNVNTGGGGGGASNYYPNTGTGGNGGSGVVIIRSLSTAASTTGSPTVTTDGSYTVYKFTQTGTITF